MYNNEKSHERYIPANLNMNGTSDCLLVFLKMKKKVNIKQITMTSYIVLNYSDHIYIWLINNYYQLPNRIFYHKDYRGICFFHWFTITTSFHQYRCSIITQITEEITILLILIRVLKLLDVFSPNPFKILTAFPQLLIKNCPVFTHGTFNTTNLIENLE